MPSCHSKLFFLNCLKLHALQLLVHEIKMARLLKSVFTKTRRLLLAPRELWVVLLLKLINSFALFSSLTVFFIFLTDEFKFGYSQAGYIVGVTGLTASLFGIFCGRIIDVLGVRRAYVLGALCGTVGAVMVAFAGNLTTLFISMFIFTPIGLALGVPVLSIGVKQYTFYANRTLAFGAFYMVMNLGATFSYLTVEAIQEQFRQGVDVRQYHATAVRLIFALSAICVCVSAMLAALALRDIEVDENGHIKTYDRKQPDKQRREQPDAATDQLCCSTARRLVKDAFFWRLVAFQFVLLGVTMVFRHMDNTFPTYIRNTLGKEAKFAALKAINPILIFILVPVFSYTLQNVDLYGVMMFGSAISAASVFIMVAPSSYTISTLFFIMFSVGEAIYSPRSIEYVMILSPHGKEGSYTALAYIPLFLAKFGADILSGNLLHWYCPDDHTPTCSTMWLVVALIALASPVGLFVFMRFIHSEQVKKLIAARNELPYLSENEEIVVDMLHEQLQSPKTRQNGDVELNSASVAENEDLLQVNPL